jgi:hypothetical protein
VLELGGQGAEELSGRGDAEARLTRNGCCEVVRVIGEEPIRVCFAGREENWEISLMADEMAGGLDFGERREGNGFRIG